MIFFEILFDLTVKGAIVQGLFLTFIFNSRKNLQRRQNHILSILLLLLSASLLYSLHAQKVSHVLNKSPFQINEPFILLLGPIMWLYVKELTTGSAPLSAKLLLHFAPIIGLSLFFMPFHLHSSQSLYVSFIFEHQTLFRITGALLIVVQYTFYLVKIWNLLMSYRKRLKTEFSNIGDKSLSWIMQVLVLFIFSYISVVVLFVLDIHLYNTELALMIGSFILAILMFWVGYKGMFQTQLFSAIGTEEQPQKEQSSTEPDQNFQKEVEQLKAVMQSEKPYLNPDLTLADLAKTVQVPRNTLSYIINNSLNENFYSFINSYRVEEVKTALANPKNKEFTILSIAFDAGFNSKSTFNSIFKQKTGLSPSQYRSGHA